MELLLLVVSFIGVSVIASIIGVREYNRIKKVNKYRAEREAQRKIRLQEKRDQFNAFQRLIETYERDCAECFEHDYTQYLECHPGDYNGKKKHMHNFDLKAPCNMCGRKDDPSYREAYERLEKPIKNFRAQLSEFTAGEVINLFTL